MRSIWRRLMGWFFQPEDPHAIAALDGCGGPEEGIYLVHDVLAPGDALPPSAALIPPHPRHVAFPPPGDPDAASR